MMRLVLGFAALALVSACGIKDGLERPDPMWNSANAIRHECRREREHNERDPGHQQPLDRRCGQPSTTTAQPTPQTPPPSPTQPQP
jgi:hypothetical protein